MNRSEAVSCCPACGEKTQHLVEYEYSGLNDSVFNYTASFFECLSCGLVYIANISDERLALFYADECSYFEKAHFDISAPENIKKYNIYREIIVNAGLSDTPITDIGCGRGGFLIWLRNADWKANCQGVDIDLKSIPSIEENAPEGCPRVTFREGGAFALPFAGETQELLTYFHVLEHIRDLNKVFSEAFRVLNDAGHIMIEVPDAERYKDFPVGTAFWTGIREHVNHFSPGALCRALQRNGFAVIGINRKVLPTPEFSYPSLIVLARKGEGIKRAESCKNRLISSFVIRSKESLKCQAGEILEFCSPFPGMTFWGCSSELFSLLPAMKLKDFVLCDSSKVKQKCSYQGRPINDPGTVSKDGALIVAPYLHGDSIEKAAIEYGWPRQAIFRLR